MREIKCRAWDGNEMYYFNPLEIVIKNAKEQEIMQFTGLKDKNGKEIYEGDILGGIVGWPVSWIASEARFGFDIYGDTKEVELWELKEDELEVIGNIYENPELIESEASN